MKNQPTRIRRKRAKVFKYYSATDLHLNATHTLNAILCKAKNEALIHQIHTQAQVIDHVF
jgi:hypothetical protein